MINQSFNSWQQFISMGGFGDYVWSAYGVTAVVLLGLAISSYRKLKKSSPPKAPNKKWHKQPL